MNILALMGIRDANLVSPSGHKQMFAAGKWPVKPQYLEFSDKLFVLYGSFHEREISSDQNFFDFYFRVFNFWDRLFVPDF